MPQSGKFYRPDAALHLPLYLDPDVDAFMRQLAGKTGKDVQKIVNELDHRIKRMESGEELATNDQIETLKKEKLHTKDQLYAILRKASGTAA